MAQRKKRRTSKRRSSSRRKQEEYPGWVWMVFGLAIGLSVAFAVYMKDRGEATPVATTQPASMRSSIDNNAEVPAPAPAPAEEPREKRFTFYDILPNYEVTTPEQEEATAPDVPPKAIEEPGLYVLQAGSFSTSNDADRRRAELALHGIESHIQRVKVNERDYHRVYIGPTDDLDELNMLRSRLRVAKIDVLRIRLSD